jgi:hypothetical protein
MTGGIKSVVIINYCGFSFNANAEILLDINKNRMMLQVTGIFETITYPNIILINL